MIEGMLSEHAKDPMNTSLVVINSYDYEKEDIEDIMHERRIYADVFEIDHLRVE
jgi:hypothetical protein